ncbi:MAG: hypothetical protein CW338_08555 [Clostridiales bacterium]|nr:hypothetical protein [Clostridiales bacterium]
MNRDIPMSSPLRYSMRPAWNWSNMRRKRKMNKKILRAASLLLLLILCFSTVPGTAESKEPIPIPVISEDEIKPTPAGIHHYMMICIDQWGFDYHLLGSHTDGMILVTVDEYSQRIMLTSFIRDLLIQRFDGKYGRINNIFYYYQTDKLGLKRGTEDSARQGIEELVRTINTHFDLDIEKYIVVDFTQVQAIVDAIGGVDIYVSTREAKRMRSFGIPISGGAICHLSGYEAVIYMRMRKTAYEWVDENGEKHIEQQDEGRTHRTRNVLAAIAEKLADINEDEMWDVVDIVMRHTILTNITNSDLLEIVRLAGIVQGVPLEQLRLPIDKTYWQNTVAKMATEEILDWDANRQALHDFLFDQDFFVR